jgi:hypothetical protein
MAEEASNWRPEAQSFRAEDLHDYSHNFNSSLASDLLSP